MSRPINQICLNVSLITTAIILIITITLGGFSLTQHIKHVTQSEHNRLNIIAPLFMNAVAGNIILEDDRSINAIKDDFQNKYRLKELSISPDERVCPTVDNLIPTEFCWAGQIPDIKIPYFLMMKSSNLSCVQYLKDFTLWTIFPLLFLGILIPCIIQRKLKNSIVTPIVGLSKNPEKWNNSNNEAAKEVILLQRQLKEFISQRNMQLINSERLKAAEDLEKLTAQIAHDVRSPLAVMEISIGKIITEGSSTHIGLLNEAIYNIRNQMENLLLRYRNTPLSFEGACRKNTSANIKDLITSLITLKREEWNKQYGLSVSIHPECNGKFVSGDCNYLTRCISNLLNNAYEAIGEGGAIEIKCICIDQCIQLSIIDNGCGICEAQLNKVINGFSTKHSGKGLGLSNAYEYIKQLGGTLSLTSQLNKGTSVQILLPIV